MQESVVTRKAIMGDRVKLMQEQEEGPLRDRHGRSKHAAHVPACFYHTFHFVKEKHIIRVSKAAARSLVHKI